MVNCFVYIFKVGLGCGVISCCATFLFFVSLYKLPFDVYAYIFDMCTNKVFLLTYLFTYVRIITALMPVGTAIMTAIRRTHVAAHFTMGIISVTQTSRDGSVIHSMDSVVAAELQYYNYREAVFIDG